MTKEKNNNNKELKEEEILKNKETSDDSSSESQSKTESTEEKTGKSKITKKDKRDTTILELGEKLAEITDKHLRLQAEFDNFRRRTIKEKTDLIKSGGENVIVNIIPVIDDFERALDLLKEVSKDDAGKQGTLLIYNKFREFLKQNNVKEIEAIHQDFDVDLHEALTKIPAPEKKLRGKVVDVIQKGYLLNDKVIRFAKVVIGE